MRLSDFILLSEVEKKEAILHQGVLIGKRDCNEYKIFLFQFASYYVEMICNWQTKTAEEFRAFAGTNLLQPYLPSIRLNDLLQ